MQGSVRWAQLLAAGTKHVAVVLGTREAPSSPKFLVRAGTALAELALLETLSVESV